MENNTSPFVIKNKPLNSIAQEGKFEFINEKTGLERRGLKRKPEDIIERNAKSLKLDIRELRV